VRLRLYAIPGSHPCQAVEVALGLKGLDYSRVDLPPGLGQLNSLIRFGKRTVPALRVDAYKVVGSPLIMRVLDGLRPDPPLVPRDPALRAAVEEAEQWGDAVLQDAARWISQYAITQRPEAAKSFLEGSRLPEFPDAVAAAVSRGTFQAEIATLGPGRAGVERLLGELPAMLDRADELIAAGTIGGDPPNAADLQIGSSVALLLKIEDLRPAIESRPCAELARRLFTSYPGSIPRKALPGEWLRASSSRAAGGRSLTSAG
jgi:glutathione S-transferase